MTDEWVSPGSVPAKMRAITMRRFGPPDVLMMDEVETPEPRAGEVLVRVAAVSVGRLLDLLARSGKHPFAHFEFPHILGAESAGVVTTLGDGVSNVAVGDRVAVFPVIVTGNDEQTRAGYPELSPSVELIGTQRQGAYAEFVRVPAENVRLVPEGMTPLEAICVVLAGAVAMNQFDRVGGVRDHTRVVVQGAASALGSTTALLARHLGADVIVSSRSAAKRQKLRELGFDHALDPCAADFADRVREIYGGRGAQVVVDNLAVEEIWRRGFDALGPGGSVVSSGAFLGSEVPINAKRLYSLGQRVVGVRTGNLASLDRAWLEVQRGFRGVLDRSFPLEDAAAAHTYVEGEDNVGRVGITVA